MKSVKEQRQEAYKHFQTLQTWTPFLKIAKTLHQPKSRLRNFLTEAKKTGQLENKKLYSKQAGHLITFWRRTPNSRFSVSTFPKFDGGEQKK
jgi:hypothetical protein